MQDEPQESAPPPERVEPAAPEDERAEGFTRRYQPSLYLRILVIGLFAGFAIAFVLENNKHVKVHFVIGSTRASLIWVILLSVGVGIVLGALLSQLYRRRRRRK